jgi:hypothetical protein
MDRPRSLRNVLALALTAGLLATTTAYAADSAADLYNRALAQERTVRDASSNASHTAFKRAVAAYERVVA